MKEVKATPTKIVNIVSHGDWLIALDADGNLWTCPIGRYNSSGGILPNKIYYPIIGEWEPVHGK